MSRKIIFFDIDGTILPARREIPTSAIDAIHQARKNGHLCLINTGRPYTHIDPRIMEIGFDGYVCSCGGHIVFEDRVLRHESFSIEESAEIDAAVQKYGIDAAYEAEEGIWYRIDPSSETRFARAKVYYHSLGLDPYLSIDESFSFDKFCAFFREDSDKDGFRAFLQDKCTVIDRGILWEMTKPYVSKETGIMDIVKLLDAALDDCYAIGDSENDLTMLNCVPHSIAMGEAPEKVKAAVEYVTGGILEDGLAQALEHYGLI